MDALISKFYKKLDTTTTDFVRDTIHKVNWEARLVGIKGARGIGKTTLLLQYIKLRLANRLEKTLYVSLDSIWFNDKNKTFGFLKRSLITLNNHTPSSCV